MIVSNKNRRIYSSKTYSASPTAETMSRKKSIPVVVQQSHVASGRQNHSALQATSSYASSIRIKNDRKLKGPVTISQKQIYAASQRSSYASSIRPKDDKKLKMISPMIMITELSPIAVALTGAALGAAGAAAGYFFAKNDKENPEPSTVPEPSPHENEEPPAPSVKPPVEPAPSVKPPVEPAPSVSPPTAPVPSESTSTAQKFADWLFAPFERQ